MGKKKKEISLTEDFYTEAIGSCIGYMEYYKRLTELFLTVFEWVNLPPTIDERYLELGLFYDGKMVFFVDEELGCLSLRCSAGGKLSVYNIPKYRRAIAPNGYQRSLTDKDSVLIYNNYLHAPSCILAMDYAKRLFQIDKTIDINIRAQKTPLLIVCEDSQRMTMENLYKQYSGDKPVIYGTSELEQLNSIKAMNTQAPYLVDKLQQAKANIWNEALTYIGIPNMVEEKKERMLVDEVWRMQGGVFANQYSRLSSRLKACDEINHMFKDVLEKPISVKVRDEFMNKGSELINE